MLVTKAPGRGDQSRAQGQFFPGNARLAVLLSLLCAALFGAAQLNHQLNHDVAWLLEAGTRWMHGARLYRDVIEVNPPLVFYVYALISFFTFQKSLFILGVALLIFASAAWVSRLMGRRWMLAAVLICATSGALDFGQRDHIAAIMMLPYLLAGRARNLERAAIGVFAFLGLGLKPHLLLIPAGASLGRAFAERSLRPLVAPENLALAACSLVYVSMAWFIHPEFFRDMLPVGQLVYYAYGIAFQRESMNLPFVAFGTIVTLVAAARREHWPYAGALAGAMLSFFLQAKFYSYHLIPAAQISMFFGAVLMSQPRLWRLYLLVLAILTSILLSQRRTYPDLIPAGATSVLFLSPHVWSAYPLAFERNILHASRYPAIWTVPGAWSILHDKSASRDRRQKAARLLAATRQRLVSDIVAYCPDPIFADVRKRKPYFNAPFDFMAYLEADPRMPHYEAGERQEIYRVYRRQEPCPARAAGPGFRYMISSR